MPSAKNQKMHYLQAELLERSRTDSAIFDFLRESSLDGMWYWDLEEPENEWMSPEFWRLFGYEPAEMPHKASAWQEIIHPDDLTVAIDNFEQHLADPEHPYDQIVRYRHRQSEEFITVRCRGMAIRNAEGKPIRMLGAHTDLTDLKRTEEALRKANADLANARSRSEAASQAKTMFLETMSHEIRTPMNGVVGMVEALLQTPLQPNQRKIANVISSSAQSLLMLLNDILDFSRIEAGTMSMEYAPFSPRTLVGEVVGLFDQSALEKDLQLVIISKTSLTRPVGGSARCVRQVLNNLISNAIKFTPDGGRIEVNTRLENGGDEKYLVISVRDTGPGVPNALREKVFGRFVQYDHKDGSMMKGSGLGLSIARKLCELHKGKLTLRTPEGGSGAEFEARFLLGDTGPLSMEAPQSEGEKLIEPREKLRLLVVEDNELNRLVMEAMLARDGITLEFAVNGRDALERATKARYDAAIVDIRMPVMDGLQFAAELRAHERSHKTPEMPLIACSANVLPHQVETFFASGFGRHLPKPVTLSALNEALGWIESRQTRSAA